MKKLFYLGVLLISMSLNAQFFEGFENSVFPPSGWLATNAGTSDGQFWKKNTLPWPAYEGTNCAFVDRSNIGQGNTSENWLITPAITIGASKALSFYCRQTIMGDHGTLYQVRISTTSQSDLNSYTTIASWPESAMIPTLDYIRIGFSLAAYEGQTVHIAFVKVFTQPGATTAGDRWLLDNVAVGDIQPNDTGLSPVMVGQIQGHIQYATQPDCSDGVPFNSSMVNISGDLNSSVFTNDLGNYYYRYYGLTDNVIVTPNLMAPNYFNVTPPSYTFNFTEQLTNVNADFCIAPNGVHPDLDIALTPVNGTSPGFDSKYKITYQNKGTTVQSGQINLAFQDGVLDFVSASPLPDNIQTNNLVWNFTNLAPFESRSIDFLLNLNTPQENPPLNLGDVLQYTAQISTTQADETPSDNMAYLNQTVTNSLDPNDKQVSISDYGIIADDWRDLLYTIHFQNLGTAAAEKVVITDFLNSRLNANTFQLVASSHNVETKYDSSNRKLKFTFDNINLPPMASDEAASQGYVSFKIKPNADVVEGETIKNSASIYFDFNDPIITNTTSTFFYSVLATNHSDKETIALYPNPVDDVLHIQANPEISVYELQVYNLMGQLVQNAHLLDNSINVSKLKPGIYLVELSSNLGQQTFKIIKQ